MQRSFRILISLVITVGCVLIAPMALLAENVETPPPVAVDNPLDLAKDYKGEKIAFTLDIAAFKLYDAPGAKIEVYYDIPNSALEFKEIAPGELATSLIIAVRILDKEGKVVKEAANRGSTRVTDLKETKDPLLSSKFVSAVNLDPGSYTFKVGVKDNLTGKIGIQEREFEVKSPIEGQLGVSSIEFGKEVQKAKEGDDSGFLKDTLNMIVTPHPSRTYHLGDTLSVYFNIYNLMVDNASKPRFKITYKFKRTGERRVIKSEVPGERVPGKNQSHLYSFEVTKQNHFDVGDYTLFVKITDELSNKAVEVKEPFKVLK
ncbi:MAG: hypothetical protein JW941_01220 [Candidatus Coatesbacteria bacterium]|nr:hypothetical protein [Candidatus Coatesbacteria bacterium]